MVATVFTWALRGLLYPCFGAYVATIWVLGLLGLPSKGRGNYKVARTTLGAQEKGPSENIPTQYWFSVVALFGQSPSGTQVGSGGLYTVAYQGLLKVSCPLVWCGISIG